MDFRVLGCFGGDSPECRMTSFLVDGTVAVDAGAITRALSVREQRAIRHIIVSHSHMDHTATLPFLIENIFGSNQDAVTIYCTAQVLANVRRHLFNNDTWPDFTRIPDRVYPSVRFEEVLPDQPFVVPDPVGGPIEVTPIPVHHIVPTVGFLLRQAGRSILFTSDTGPTDRVWEVASQADDLAALITECSFPNRMQAVADVSLHLTPQTLARQLAKLTRTIPVYLYHFKPPYVDELKRELAGTKLPMEVQLLEQDRVYSF